MASIQMRTRKINLSFFSSPQNCSAVEAITFSSITDLHHLATFDFSIDSLQPTWDIEQMHPRLSSVSFLLLHLNECHSYSNIVSLRLLFQKILVQLFPSPFLVRSSFYFPLKTFCPPPELSLWKKRLSFSSLYTRSNPPPMRHTTAIISRIMSEQTREVLCPC